MKERFDKILFKYAKCAYCGEKGVNEIYIDYACHSICKKKANYHSPTKEQKESFPVKTTKVDGGIHSEIIFNQLTT